MYVYTYIYIYICRYRYMYFSLSLYIYIYIYTCIGVCLRQTISHMFLPPSGYLHTIKPTCSSYVYMHGLHILYTYIGHVLELFRQSCTNRCASTLCITCTHAHTARSMHALSVSVDYDASFTSSIDVELLLCV